MAQLMDRDTRLAMGENARRFIERERVDEPFTAVFDSAEYRRRVKSLDRDKESSAPLMMRILDLEVA